MDTLGNISFFNNGEPIIKAKELPNPSYVCILERKIISTRPSALKNGGLCIVSELEKGEMQPYSVQIDGTKIQAQAVGQRLDTKGSYPCNIISSDVGNMESIFVCNYGEKEGVLTVFGSSDGNEYKQQVCIPFGTIGSNVDANDRQGTSHAHSTTTITSTSSTMAVCCDLGSDAIIQYEMTTTTSNTDSEDVSLQSIERHRLSSTPGSGPRSLSVNPVHNNIAIVSLEMTGEAWLIRKKDDGYFEGIREPISLYPDNWPTDGDKEKNYNNGRWASDAVWSPCGEYVYAAARLHNSILAFRLVEDQSSLEFLQRVSTTGITPRCLCISDCGEHILVCNQHSHDLSSYRVNKNDGTLTFVNRLEVPNCACVKLVRPENIG